MAKKTVMRDGIYTRRDRPGYWISWIDAQGRRRYRKTEAQTLVQARNARSAELVRVEQQKVLGFNPPDNGRFEEIAQRFLKYQRARLTPQAFDREKGIVETHLIPFFNCKIAGIRKVDVQRYVTSRSGIVSAHSIQKELNVLKHLLNIAVEWEIIPFNPGQGVKPPKVPAGRVRYLQPTEVKAVLEACPNWLRPIVGLAVCTGMRRGEILGLRWLDVDLKHERILLPQTKNGDGRIVYLNRSAQLVIQSLPRDSLTKTTDKLFQDITPNMASVAFKRVCDSLEIADFRFHDLRHTAASWLRMQGADIHTVAQLLGHKDLRMAARYQHLSLAYLADAVARLDKIFGEVCYQDVTSPKALASGLIVTAAS